MNTYLKLLLGTTCLSGLACGVSAAPVTYSDFSDTRSTATDVTGATRVSGSIGLEKTAEASASAVASGSASEPSPIIDDGDYFRFELSAGDRFVFRLSAIGEASVAISPDNAIFPDSGGEASASGSDPGGEASASASDPGSGGEASASGSDPGGEASASASDPGGLASDSDPLAADASASASAGSPDPIFGSFTFSLRDLAFEPLDFSQDFDADGSMLGDFTALTDGPVYFGISDYTGSGAMTFEMDVSAAATPVSEPSSLAPVAAGAAAAGGLGFLRRRRRKRVR